MHKNIKQKFKSLYGGEPTLFRSPGRINLLGEHTDYNEGYVLPAAIDKEIICAIAPNGMPVIRLHALDLGNSFEIEVDKIKPTDSGWANYILGVAAQYRKMGVTIQGFDAVFGGDIPLGAGLSSSAALECAFAYALDQLWNTQLQKLEMVKMAQMAEHEYAGVKCGIMDQFASMFGKKDHVIQLDCRSLDYSHFKIALHDFELILCDSHVKHSLTSSAYNERREQCEEGTRILKGQFPEINSLRDVKPEQLIAMKEAVDPLVYKRCSYVVHENLRVLKAVEMLDADDLKGFGELMYTTHHGLSIDYEVSCPELDFLVNFTETLEFVLGSRMMGGGFGGCSINIVKSSQVEEFIDKISKAYKQNTGIDMSAYRVKIENGTSKISE
ncbi:MAG: galactokinase [Cyclobacteriaceae bacterium]|nr:galactokinase [Cyclobacteriaceae bacterium]